MLKLRYMTLQDIPAIVEIDRASFPNPWSERSYHFEIRENQSAHMITLEDEGSAIPVVGYGGLWLFDDESHISTIAVPENRRGNGYGEVLLTGMLNRSMLLGATYTVLEVRVSNDAALQLYRKYEFEVVHRRKRYYNNGEDAFMMYLNPMDEAYRGRFEERMSALRKRVAYQDVLAEGKSLS